MRIPTVKLVYPIAAVAVTTGYIMSNAISSWNDSMIRNVTSGTMLTSTGWNALVNNTDYLSGQVSALLTANSNLSAQIAALQTTNSTLSGQIAALQAANSNLNASNLTSGTVANERLGTLWNAAWLNAGVAANNVVQLNASAKLPAVDGSLLTNLPLSTVPSWAIMAFNLAACPTGWSNFAAGAGRFLVGVGTSVAGGTATYTLWNSGGENWHTLSIGEMPSHNHQLGRETITASNGAGINVGADAIQGLAHYTGNQWWDWPHENRPPYYAVLYCVKN